MLKHRRAAESLVFPVKRPHPPMKRRVARANVLEVAPELLHVRDVESDDRDVKTHVRFRKLAAKVERPAGGGSGELLFRAIECGEELDDGFFVGFLGRGEAAFVDAVVDVVVRPFVGRFDLGLQLGREEIEFGILFRKHVVELGVEHADDLAGLVVDDSLRFFVEKDGHRDATRVIRVDGKVELAKILVVGMERIGLGVLAADCFALSDEAPSLWEWRGESLGASSKEQEVFYLCPSQAANEQQ